MTLLEKLDALKRQTGDSNASLARNAGIPVTTIYGLYQKGYANMQLSTLQALCSYFGVPLDYLAKDTDDNSTEPAPQDRLSEKEREFLDAFQGLNASNRRLLLGIAALLAQEQSTDPDPQD